MDLRIFFSWILFTLDTVLIVCAVTSFRSVKPIGRQVGWLLITLLPPITGNLIIIGTSAKMVSVIGYYMIFLGMDCVMAALVRFTDVYCEGIGHGQREPIGMYVILGLDAVQLLLNPVFGHAFGMECIDVQGLPYYRVIPYAGLAAHRVVDYAVFVCVSLIFIVGALQTARIYRERYTVILIAMILVALWQTYYIFSRMPMDRSMIGYGFLGILVFYLSLYYRPLRLLDRMLSKIASNMPEALFVFDPAGKCIWANEPGLKMTDASESELDLISGRLSELFGSSSIRRADWSDNRVIGEDDDARYYTLEGHVVRDQKSYLAGSFLSIRDNTEEQRGIQNEMYRSTHDGMTGLYTKQYLFECIAKNLREHPDTEYQVVYIDVKDFKIVNDIFGTAFGDKAICRIADWIRQGMNDRCVYGRLVGDTFGAMMPVADFDKDSLENELNNFVVSDGNVEHRLQIHLGIYVVDDPELDVSVMFDRAHLAISSIKDNYKKHIVYYDGKLRDRILWEQKLVEELHGAIEDRQICPYLQPIADRSGQVVGAEALVRWIHPEHGFMSPAMFVPLYEGNGMIVELDRYMWRCACEILSGWTGEKKDLFISVNISPKDFYYIDVVSEIRQLVREYGIEPRRLRLEITETVMMSDSEERMKLLEEFRDAGFIVEMDDFGSGYSSLNLLKDMPVDVLKIDMKFLSASDNYGRSETIIKNIIQLSDELKIASLTEGVETGQQFAQLSGMGCKLFQGYYFARPMPVEEFERFVLKSGIK